MPNGAEYPRLRSVESGCGVHRQLHQRRRLVRLQCGFGSGRRTFELSIFGGEHRENHSRAWRNRAFRSRCSLHQTSARQLAAELLATNSISR
ncbi:hypothetical protein VTN00DRAFT_7078 [Thermoascus crustaceus]|uniref:uncharacterized protein n=1 Tax=Thermoascus crustaceus TaxID=5088 RepID=UPI003744822C